MFYRPPFWKTVLTYGALATAVATGLTGCIPAQDAAIRRESKNAALREYCRKEALRTGIPSGAQPAIDAYVADCVDKK